MKKLEFSLLNTYDNKNEPIIYITDDFIYNKLQLKVKNVSSEDVVFKDNDDEDGLYIEPPASLLNDGKIKEVNIALTGWHSSFYDEDGEIGWSIIPDQKTVLKPQNSLSFKISNIAVSQNVSAGDILYFKAGYGDEDERPIQLPISLAKPPSSQKQDLAEILDYDREVSVTISPDPQNSICNKDLEFDLINSNRRKPLVAGKDAWDDKNKPRFLIAFVAGTTPGALTDLDSLGKVDIEVDDPNKWTVTPACPIWELTPNLDNNYAIFDADESISLSINNLVVTTPQGVTPMYISYANIPGYNDGCFTATIEKNPPTPEIHFRPISVSINLGDAVHLSWSTVAIRSVCLSYETDGYPKEIDSNINKGDISVNEKDFTVPDKPTKKGLYFYTLQAIDYSGSSHSPQVSVTVI